MVGRNNAAVIAQIGRMTTPQITEGKSIDFAGAVDRFMRGYNQGKEWKEDALKAERKDAYIEALAGGNQDEINQAWAKYDPQGFADHLSNQAQRAEERQWQLDDLAAKQQFQRELLADKLRNEFALAKYKADMGGGNDYTAAMKNVQAMVAQGFTPQEAWAVQFAGNNPNFDTSNLGKKGIEAYDKKMGENAADEVMAQKQMETLTPMAQAARDRAKKALEDGTGLGQIGGLGWTTGKGGRNREDVASVKRQMNIMLRSKLKAVGVGSKELDAAREAEAYRANLDPTLPIEQQEAIIDNFFTDYVNGNLEKELREKYGGHC